MLNTQRIRLSLDSLSSSLTDRVTCTVCTLLETLSEPVPWLPLSHDE